MKETQDIRASHIAIAVLNGLLCFAAIFLNSVTIKALRKTLPLPKQLKTLLLSLTVSDLGVGVIVHPLYIAVNIMDFQQISHNGHTYEATKNAFLVAANLLLYASLFGVIALGADRFLAIHLHLRYQELATHRRVVALVILIWISSTTISLPRPWADMQIIFIAFAIINSSCLVIAALLYCKLYVTAKRHIKQITTQRGQDLGRKKELLRNAATLTKSSTGTLFVYLALLVCYLPNACLLVMYPILGQNTTIKTMQLYTLTLLFLNSSLNPLIYCWKMRHIRRAVMDILPNIMRNRNYQG